jgi:hypothetical protein
MIPPLELPAPVSGPAFYNHFRLGVEVHPVVRLRVQVTEETLAQPLKGNDDIGAATPTLIPTLPALTS